MSSLFKIQNKKITKSCNKTKKKYKNNKMGPKKVKYLKYPIVSFYSTYQDNLIFALAKAKKFQPFHYEMNI